MLWVIKMNVLYFIIPKQEIKTLNNNATIKEACDMLDESGFTAIPVIDSKGKYLFTISEGDLLRHIRNNHHDFDKIMQMPIKNIRIKKNIAPISSNKDIMELIGLSLDQNFIPVIDDLNHFVGIVTRKTIISYFKKKISSLD